MRDTKNWGNPSRWACARTARVSVLLRFYFLPYYHLNLDFLISVVATLIGMVGGALGHIS